MLKVGDVIDGKYEILKLIGRGGMSRVWLASDRRLNKLWAVKEAMLEGRDKDNVLRSQTLVAEASLMKALDHPALPRIVDIFQEEDRVLVVMDYVDGESLNKKMRNAGHPMAQQDVIDWGIQLCDVLQYLHTRKPPIVYRDMKPSNVMLNDRGVVKLIDFGIAREYKEYRTADTQVLGTDGYASPEQRNPALQTDARADIYSLGVTLYHLVTGHSPNEDTVLHPIREFNPTLSEGLEYIITKATRSDREDRYQSCAEMAYDLEHYDQLTAAYRKEQRAKVKRFNTLWIAGALCLALGAGCIAGSFAAKRSTYDSLMASAQVASTEGSTENGTCQASTLYEQAIEKEPSEIEPYLALIEVYGEDSVFSQKEATEWLNIYNANYDSIEDDPQYAELCYEVGYLYLMYYEYDESDEKSENFVQTAAKTAAEWFERALDSAKSQGDESELSSEDKTSAEIYSVIGHFYDNYDDSRKDASETCAEYWAALESAVDELDDGATSMLKLRLYYIVYCAINSEGYLEDFKGSGVTQGQAEELLTSVLEGTAEVSKTNGTSQATKLIDVILEDDLVDADDVEGTKTLSSAWKTIQTVFDGVADSADDTADSLDDGEADA